MSAAKINVATTHGTLVFVTKSDGTVIVRLKGRPGVIATASRIADNKFEVESAENAAGIRNVYMGRTPQQAWKRFAKAAFA